MTVQERINGSTAPEPFRFTLRDYLLLSESGAFNAYAKTELIEGVIVAVNAQYSRHARLQTALLRRLADACDGLQGNLGAWVEVSISMSDRSMPRPDIVVSHGLPDDGPVEFASIALIVEIADSSLGYDLGDKLRFYAAAGLAEYWVVDGNARVIHQMWKPVGEAYKERREMGFGEGIDAITIEGLSIETVSL